MTDWTGAGVIGAATDWQLAIGGDSVTAAILLNAVVTSAGDPKATLYYQTATTRTDAPGPWTAVTSGLILSGGTLENAKANISLTAVTGGKMWIRFAVFLQPDTGGTAPVAADVTLSVALTQFGAMVGSFRQQLVSSVSSDACLAIAGWLPRATVAKLAASFIVASADANFMVRLVYRRALVSQSAPSSWLNTADNGSTGPAERHTGDLAPAFGDYQWVQPGIAWSSSSGTSKGDVAVAVGVRIS